MKSLVIFAVLITPWCGAQNGRGPQSQEHGHGWDIRLAVPGEPGSDYPTLGNIPRTGFSCAGKEPGYYADVEAGCQVFRVCTVGSTYGFQSFLCPNGTLFNQEVFVCDWWMNVKCKNNDRLVTNDKFGNLRLGPQLMKDIKKMLTHTMRNPYDKSAMKSNLIVMQDYKPPAGQLFPNGALIAGPERPPNNVYIPSKQILAPNFNQNYGLNDIAFAASTPDTRYVPAGFTNRPSNADAELFQRQRQQSAQYVQNNLQPIQRLQPPNIISNGHSEPYVYNKNTEFTNNFKQTRPNQNYNQVNAQYTQKSIQGPQNIQRGQLNQRQRAQYTEVKKTQLNGGKQNEFGSYTKQQYNQEKQPYTYKTPVPTLPIDLNSISDRELKQNLVSTVVPSTAVTKTLAYGQVLPDRKRPKSRITIKTWVVKPSKAARLIAEPTPYTYDRPTQPPTERIVESTPYVYNRPTNPSPARIVEASPYVYNRPTNPSPARIVEASPYVYNRPTNPPPARIVESTSYVYNRPTNPPPARIVTEETPTPYVYNPPSTTHKPEKIVDDDDDDDQAYVYNRPTVAAKQIESTGNDPSRKYVPPNPTFSTPRNSLVARISLTPSASPPTQASRVYLAPTTFKPVARLYLPPPISTAELSRQYLAPIQQLPNQNSRLIAAPSTPAPAYALPDRTVNRSSSAPSKQSQPGYNNGRNLTFTDILTKEKLDLTVNDIVKDTGNILQTASPPQFEQYQDDVGAVTFPANKYVPTETAESGENLTSQSPAATSPSKSARIIQEPARSLEPPEESLIKNSNVNTNQIAMLPFFKEPALPNTIERTVSLKITIPESVASLIFKGDNETDYHDLEILNTGSSNYLVLSNSRNRDEGDFIPIGKLSGNKQTNISNSQALVFSILADSLNAAKKYSNIVKQEVLTSTSTQAPQLQNLNNEDLSHITDKISQLTSSQYSVQNNFNAQRASTQSTTISTQNSQVPNNEKLRQSAQYNNAPQTPKSLYSSPYQTENTQSENVFDIKQDQQIYSGQLYQLPVPEVTSQIYNRPQAAKLIQTTSQQTTQPIRPTPQFTTQNNVANHNFVKQSSAEVEIVQSQTLPLNPAKLQLAPSNEPESFYSQETLNNLLNTDNGISAQLQDKIVGVIPHPIEDNKVVSYEKDQTYYLFSKFDKNDQSNRGRTRPPGLITFQFVPSVSYQLEDENEQQKLLNSFQIDEFGAPRDTNTKANLVQESDEQRATIVSNIDYTIEHPSSKQINGLTFVNALYNGPSSYSAPQGSVGSLSRQTLLQDNLSSRLEKFDEKSSANGYPKTTPTPRFVF